MATTDEGTAQTRLHRRRVLAIDAEVQSQVIRSWQIIDVRDIDRTSDAWYQLVSRIVLSGRNRTVDEGMRYVRDLVEAERGFPVEPTPATPIETSRLRSRMYGAGPWTLKQRIGQGLAPQQASRSAMARLAGEATRTVLEGARETVTETAKSQGFRWQRIARADACAFCALLVSRGAVFASGDTARFQAHRNCRCTAEMVVRDAGFETDQAKEWSDLYDSSVREAREAGELARGTSNDLLNAFRPGLRARLTDLAASGRHHGPTCDVSGFVM